MIFWHVSKMPVKVSKTVTHHFIYTSQALHLIKNFKSKLWDLSVDILFILTSISTMYISFSNFLEFCLTDKAQ